MWGKDLRKKLNYLPEVVPLRAENEFRPPPNNEILAPFSDFQDFLRVSSSILCKNSPSSRLLPNVTVQMHAVVAAQSPWSVKRFRILLLLLDGMQVACVQTSPISFHPRKREGSLVPILKQVEGNRRRLHAG